LQPGQRDDSGQRHQHRDYAFDNCGDLITITIGSGVTSIGDGAFEFCNSLTGVYFQGNAPADIALNAFGIDDDYSAVAYYMPGTAGWDWFSNNVLPAKFWFLPYPLIIGNGPNFGVQSNTFGFVISWATNASVVVEACTNLANPVWTPLQTISLTNGSGYFSDPQWTNYPSRFYSLQMP
jgi:hypothetical protein